MGIKGLFSFIKRWDNIAPIEEGVRGEDIGIDLFWFLHRSKGDIAKLQEMFHPFLQTARSVLVVVDGNVKTEEREVELKERRTALATKREQVEAIIADIEQAIPNVSEESQQILERYMEQLKGQIWTPSPEYITQAIVWLQTEHVKIIEAEGEADDVLVELQRDGDVTLIVSNDSDVIALGAERVLQVVPHKKNLGRTFTKRRVMEKLRFTDHQWVSFIWLCKHMKETDVLLAFSLISVYGDVERSVQRWEEMHSVSLV